MMQSKKSAPVDSIGVFLRGVSRKNEPRPATAEAIEAGVAANTVLVQLAREGRDLDIEDLHDRISNLSITRLARAVTGLEEAELVSVNPETDAVSLTDRGRTAANILLFTVRSPDK